jgi:hypothetical protein
LASSAEEKSNFASRMAGMRRLAEGGQDVMDELHGMLFLIFSLVEEARAGQVSSGNSGNAQVFHGAKLVADLGVHGILRSLLINMGGSFRLWCLTRL